MTDLPDEFTATDPVSGTTFSLDSKSKNYLTVKSEEYGRREGVRFEFARALIQYGRDMERAEIEADEQPLKTEMTASQKNGLLCFDIGGLQIAMDEEQARAVKGVIDSWLAGDPTGWSRGEG